MTYESNSFRPHNRIDPSEGFTRTGPIKDLAVHVHARLVNKMMPYPTPEVQAQADDAGVEVSEMRSKLSISELNQQNLYDYYITKTYDCKEEIRGMLSDKENERVGNFNETIKEIKDAMISNITMIDAIKMVNIITHVTVHNMWREICALRTNAEWLEKAGYPEGNTAINKLEFLIRR